MDIVSEGDNINSPYNLQRNGILRYSSDRFERYPENGSQTGEQLKLKPLFYDLYMRPGAIYWFDRQTNISGVGEVIAWDINYFTFDFDYMSKQRVTHINKWHNDACFIRCVED